MERVGLRSETGPGKPYCIRPDGSTGISSFGVKREIPGVAATGDVSVGVVSGLVVDVEGLRSEPMKIVAAAAPAAADTPATKANVDFDIVKLCMRYHCFINIMPCIMRPNSLAFLEVIYGAGPLRGTATCQPYYVHMYKYRAN